MSNEEYLQGYKDGYRDGLRDSKTQEAPKPVVPKPVPTPKPIIPVKEVPPKPAHQQPTPQPVLPWTPPTGVKPNPVSPGEMYNRCYKCGQLIHSEYRICSDLYCPWAKYSPLIVRD